MGLRRGLPVVPGLSCEIVRPNDVHLVGYDLDGNEVSIEADELEGRCFQHELDHLDGVLCSSASTTTSARRAKRAFREMDLRGREPSRPPPG